MVLLVRPRRYELCPCFQSQLLVEVADNDRRLEKVIGVSNGEDLRVHIGP